LIVIASIHQPSASTFALFDKLLLLSGGKPQYFGPVNSLGGYLESVGYPIPQHTNPAEFVLELLNSDFDQDQQQSQNRLAVMQQRWNNGQRAQSLAIEIEASVLEKKPVNADSVSYSNRNMASDVLTLVHRSFIKSYRDLVAYGIRIAMYLGE
jgi:ABC-type multidrug transport system ATPase subunit